MKEVVIGNRVCRIIEKGKPEKAIYLVSENDEMLEEKLKYLDDFVIVLYSAEDWNRDLSPWPYRMNKNFDFAGKGIDTRRWLVEECVEYVRNTYGDIRHYPCGYSLAGLFSLWCLYEEDVFDGAGSFSGSLWFEGWHDYVEKEKVRDTSRVYLSLGNRESHSRNPVMARVYDETVHQQEVLDKQCTCCFGINEGGHFDNVAERIADGIRWLLAGDID